LIALDDDTGGAAQPVDIARSHLRVTNSQMAQLRGVTGGKVFCVADETAGAIIATGGGGADTGLFLQRFIPSWENVRIDGVPIADQPLTETTAAAVNTCSVLGNVNNTVATHTNPGTFVMINDDTAAAQTCTGAGTNNLTGTGTFRSVCKCLTTGLWGVP
jgi:hypothetical protein